ncbi:potassium channel family protein [Rhodoferax sp.]|uniref:potassium channel family protein n=1 Tax=Rhodoferax sp. TaxID=50421 RepID=UPI00275901BD|nr:potassium channel protein [Rhodoferax sp.]
MKRIFRGTHFAGLRLGAAALAMIHVVGTLGYHYLGRPSATWIDSFYMTFITVATIGFSETVDLSRHPMGRLFTVGIAFLGIGTMTYMFSTFVALLLESDLNTALKRKRMKKEIAKLSGHYIICGIGRVGTNVANELVKTHRTLVVIEQDRKALDDWLENHPQTLFLHDDAADDDALRSAGVMACSGVFAVTGDDSHNLVVSLSVKLLNPKVRVVARVHDIRNVNKARRAGADEIVSPDFTGGMRIASAMVRPHVVNFMDQMLRSDDGLRVEEVLVPIGFEARPIKDLLPKSRDYILMATHEHGHWVFNPDDDHVVRAGHVIVIMANPGGRESVEQMINA